MKKWTWVLIPLTALVVYLVSKPAEIPPKAPLQGPFAPALTRLSPVTLKADLSDLALKDQKALGLLIQASVIIDRLYWLQHYGDPIPLLAHAPDEVARQLLLENHGPWDKLRDLAPIFGDFPPQPLGANFYPSDFDETKAKQLPLKIRQNPYSLVRQNQKGQLRQVPYARAFQPELAQVARLLRQAAALFSDTQFAAYLKARAEGLQTDRFQPSDRLWVALKTNPFDLIIGPIESYDDRLLGVKTAYEAMLLKRDFTWDQKLSQWEAQLPHFQQSLPVEAEYKSETPGPTAGLAVFDLLYARGQANSGPKALAVNLPNSEEIQLQQGSRRIQLKNVMAAKYERILKPIALELLALDQAEQTSFAAFFNTTMFHEVAHGLGLKHLVGRSGTVRQALGEVADDLEENKADLLALYFIAQLLEEDQLQGDLETYYLTFTADMLRSMRFGMESAHGRAAMARWNRFIQAGAIVRQEGRYRVQVPTMGKEITAQAREVLLFQGQGDLAQVKAWLKTNAQLNPDLKQDLARLEKANIPADIRFIQGEEFLGLQPKEEN